MPSLPPNTSILDLNLAFKKKLIHFYLLKDNKLIYLIIVNK